MNGLALGIDLGTSGIRSAVVDRGGAVLSMARADYGPHAAGRSDANAWWTGVQACLAAQIDDLGAKGIDQRRIERVGVDGTSGSMVLTDAGLNPVTQALMYSSSGFEAEAEIIAAHAPDTHITRGSGSALARALRLQSEDTEGRAVHLLHQADFIAAKLMGTGGHSDHNNALKTGFDPGTGYWPDWFADIGLRTDLLPEVVPAGTPLNPIAGEKAARFGLSPGAMIHAGTTDSIAAFLACAPMELGVAVTSLGTTLAVKLLSDRRIDAPALGLYSHRLGNGWLVGGASNTGGGVLRDFFTVDELAALSQRIDPALPSRLDYYPLRRPGERFPVNDPTLAPRMTPRPADDAGFLHELLEGIARIERRCYEAMTEQGAPWPTRVFTAGGGGANPVWTAIRSRILGLPLPSAEASEAAIGVARLVAKTGPGSATAASN